MFAKTASTNQKNIPNHFKHMTRSAEPKSNPKSGAWYHEVVGKGEAVIVDTLVANETGGFLCTTKPLSTDEAGSAGPPAASASIR